MSGPPRASIPNGDCRRRARRNSGRFGRSPWTTAEISTRADMAAPRLFRRGGSRLSCRRHHVFGTRGSARARKMPLLTPPSPRPAAPARYGLASLSTLVVLGVAVANDTVLEVMALVRREARSARVTLESQLADDLPASPAASTVSSRDGFSRPWPTCRTGRGSVRSGRANGLQLWIEERVPAHWPSLGEVHHQVLPPRAARARRGARRGAHAAAPRAKVERP